MFEYSGTTRILDEQVSDQRDAGTLEDLTYEAADGRHVSAYVISPNVPIVAAALYMHMLAPGADRSQFLDEGWQLASSGIGSIHVQGYFPWAIQPSGPENDRRLVMAEVAGLRHALDLIGLKLGRSGIRSVFVGHDYGAMYGALLAHADDRISGLAFVAGHPDFATWFIKYWQIPVNAETYRAAMKDLDPITHLAALRKIPLLFQFATDDEFVSVKDRADILAAAGGKHEAVVYEADHRMNDAAGAYRTEWLRDVLLS
jgi:pimeloyl-ACP methyl ester carboxylesterase